MLTTLQSRNRRKARNRYSLTHKSRGRIRLSVYRSGKHIYAQIIDDKAGKTLVAASSMEKDLRTKLKSGANKEAAKAIGQLVAERAVKAGIKEVVFDRGNHIFHGRIKELAEAARAGGLSF